MQEIRGSNGSIFQPLITSRCGVSVEYFFYKTVFHQINSSECVINCTRSSRMDKDYVCGCGKAYGSYPAFSTHRKTKHNNRRVSGTIMPEQGKAKRGRPSCDFKKIPVSNESQRRHYQGLNVIEMGLLNLETQYKGKILNQPDNQTSLQAYSELSLLRCSREEDNSRIEDLIEFARLTVNHTKQETTSNILHFLSKFIQFGLERQSLLSMEIYNSFFDENKIKLMNSGLGIGFYLSVAVMMARWLYAVGKSHQTLKISLQQQCGQRESV